MKTIATLLIVFVVFPSFALLFPTQQSEAFHHLKEVNKEWSNYTEFITPIEISFATDRDRISYHLLSVESSLRSKITTHLSKKQRQNRITMLDELHQYALDMKFPVNTYHTHRQPYFIDIYGTHCAVGYLVMKSGHGDISQDISKIQNYAYVDEIDSPELMNWSIDYGFTLDELAWIQPTYPDNRPYTQIGSGTNGRVIAIERALPNYGGEIYVAGDFTMLRDVPCLNVAVYDGNQLTCLGGGINGKVNDMEIVSNYNGNHVIYLAGLFTYQGETFPIAIFQNGVWNYLSITNVIEATAIHVPTNYDWYVGCKNSDGTYGLRACYNSISNNLQWSGRGVVNGRINTIASNSYGLAFGGKFDKIINRYVEWNDSVPSIVYDTVLTNNVAFVHPYYDDVNDQYLYHCKAPEGEMPDTVFASKGIGHNFYFGGSATLNPESSGVLLTKVGNLESEPLITLSDFDYLYDSSQAVYDMEFNTTASALIIGGDLSRLENAGIYMYWGRNLYAYNFASGLISSEGYFNNHVYAVEYSQEKLMVGGDFTGKNQSETNTLLHLAETQLNLSVDNVEKNNLFSLSPNPAASEIRISGIEDNETFIEITDLQGKIVIPYHIYSESIHVNTLQQGVYVANIIRKDYPIAFIKFVKM